MDNLTRVVVSIVSIGLRTTSSAIFARIVNGFAHLSRGTDGHDLLVYRLRAIPGGMAIPGELNDRQRRPVWDNYRNWYYQMFLGMSLHQVQMNCGMTVERYQKRLSHGGTERQRHRAGI